MGKTGSPGPRSPGMSKAGLNVMLAPKEYKPRWDWALGLEPGIWAGFGSTFCSYLVATCHLQCAEPFVLLSKYITDSVPVLKTTLGDQSIWANFLQRAFKMHDSGAK